MFLCFHFDLSTHFFFYMFFVLFSSYSNQTFRAFIVNLKDHHFLIFYLFFLLVFLYFSWTLNLIRRLFHSTPKNFFFIVFLFSPLNFPQLGWERERELWHYTRCKGAKVFLFGWDICDTYAQLNIKCYHQTHKYLLVMKMGI